MKINLLQLYLIISFTTLFSCKTNPDIEKPDNLIVTKHNPLIYLIDYIKENDKTIISWKYNARYENFKTIHLKKSSGEEIASINFPVDHYELGNSVNLKNIILQVENKKGQFSETYSLNLDNDLFYETLIETAPIKRILIEKNTSMPFFYKKGESNPVQLFGVNYVRLRGQESRLKGDHSSFDAATVSTEADYNPYHAETLFRTLKSKGLNLVRVFLIGRTSINPGISGPTTLNEPVYGPYMDNFVDFLKRARKYGIYVFPSIGDGELPLNAYYRQKVPNHDISSLRNYFPFVEEAVNAKAEYLKAIVNYIKNSDPTLINTLFAIQLQNEYALNANVWPLTMSAGSFGAYWGETYDMANGQSRQKLADDATILYHNKMVEALDQVEPDLLVGEGLFTLWAVGKNTKTAFGLYSGNFQDERYPPSFNVMIRSNLDFIDIHTYPINAKTSIPIHFDENMNSMLEGSTELNDIISKKPIIMGEFGAFYRTESSDIATTAGRMKELGKLSIDRGFGGWCYWTFDTFEQIDLFNMIEQNSSILNTLQVKPPSNK